MHPDFDVTNPSKVNLLKLLSQYPNIFARPEMSSVYLGIACCQAKNNK